MDSSVALRNWILEMLSYGAPPGVILGESESLSWSRPEILEVLAGLGRQLELARDRRRMAQSHASWMGGILRSLNSGSTVAKRQDIEAEEFYRYYYALNRPVILKSVVTSAEFQHSFATIKAGYGGVTVEAMCSRVEGGAAASRSERVTMLFAEFVDRILSEKDSPLYITAQNNVIWGPIGELFSSFSPVPNILDSSRCRDASLWIGPQGACTPLHYDKRNVLIIQLLGTKQIWLLSPYEEVFLYHNADSLTSEVDPSDPDFVRFPLSRFARSAAVKVEEGDALFVPVGWWHQVHSLSPTLSMSMSNFMVDNIFTDNVY